MLGITCFCYCRILQQINSADIESLATENRFNWRLNVERRATRKILGYVLIYVVQWGPAVPYMLLLLLNQEPLWLYFICATAVNFGGIGNSILYVVNEGLFLPPRALSVSAAGADLPRGDRQLHPAYGFPASTSATHPKRTLFGKPSSTSWWRCCGPFDESRSTGDGDELDSFSSIDLSDVESHDPERRFSLAVGDMAAVVGMTRFQRSSCPQMMVVLPMFPEPTFASPHSC